MSDHIQVSLDAIRRWPTPVARHWLEGFLEDARCDDNILSVVAVGSTVRSGVPSEDLDLVVVCRARAAFGYKPSVEIDVRTFSLDSIDDELSNAHPLLGWAVKLGVSIFDRHKTWSGIVEAWRDRVPLPDPLLARQRAAKVLASLTTVREFGDDVAIDELNLSYLTLLARAALSEHGIFPASRPELPGQLKAIGVEGLSDELKAAIRKRETHHAPPLAPLTAAADGFPSPSRKSPAPPRS